MPFTPPDPNDTIPPPTPLAPIVVRPLAATDAAAARALFTSAFGNTLYAEAPRTALARALDGPNDGEAGGVVAVADGEVVGVAVYGFVPGTDRTAKMHGMAVAADSRRHGVARTLIDAFVAELTGAGARLVVVEFPDAPELAGGRTLLLHSRFAEEARLADYFLDGIALAFLRRDLV
jgi:ribosomal protein S18 acetylase RimI-like enzyme